MISRYIDQINIVPTSCTCFTLTVREGFDRDGIMGVDMVVVVRHKPDHTSGRAGFEAGLDKARSEDPKL